MLKRDILFVPGGDFSVRDIDAFTVCVMIGVSTDIFLFFICFYLCTFLLFFYSFRFYLCTVCTIFIIIIIIITRNKSIAP